MQCQPISANRFCVSTSLSWFLLIFVSQNSRLVLGILQHSELFTSPSSLLTSTLCPCQKHPFTKIQVRYFFSTKSGCPGNLGELSLYLNPLTPQPFPYNHLRLRILGVNSSHILVPLFCRKFIHRVNRQVIRWNRLIAKIGIFRQWCK